MHGLFCHGILVCLLALATPALAQNAIFSFEGFVDGAALTNQYAGAMFGNAIVLSVGITLDEFEFPPHAGSNVASDNGGPMTIAFASPVRGFAGHFTYGVRLTLQAFDSSNSLLDSAPSAFSNNQALSGASGSQPNELLKVTSAKGIAKVVIAGAPQGTSFTIDDAIVITRCDLNQDGFINAIDTQAILNEALGATNADDDLNGDGAVNVVDVQIVINAALGNGCAAK
jgi:hypothetical protein